MGAYDYKNLTDSQAVDLVNLSHQLAVYTQLDSILTLPVGTILDGIGDFFGDGTLTSNPIHTSTLPDGWRVVDPSDLGLADSSVDVDGYIKLVSPTTGDLDGGPQLQVLAQEDAEGNLTRLAISYCGTNSLLDVADYYYLNSGAELAEPMEPVLQAIAGYAQDNGLDGSDVLVTGYSLGGGMTNIQARFADTLADGFFADSDYVGHAAPVIYDEGGRVLNVGFENDVIHRATGDHGDFWTALAAADPLLSNSDTSYDSSLDNMVVFDGVYANADVTLAVDSIVSVLAWWGHISGLVTDAVTRLGESVFYEFTHQDSTMIISGLGADLRSITWVEDKSSPTSNHFGTPAFIVGTQYDDKLSDGAANDWLDGGAGDDMIRVSDGLNRVEGGAGEDTLRLLADADDVSVYRLADGTMVFDSGDGLTVAHNIEKVQIGETGLLGLIDWVTDYSIQGDRLEDEHWSLFEWGDKDIGYSQAIEGSAGADALEGSAVFARDGNDTISGTADADLLHGGEGRDQIYGGAGDDRLYGAEHGDMLVAGAGTDRLNGGHGDDLFVFNAALSGTAIVEDYNDLAGEADQLLFYGGDAAAALASAQQQDGDVVISHGNMTVVLEGTTLADLDGLLMA